MKRILGLLAAFTLAAAAALAFAVSTSASTTFSVNPWAYACGTTHTGNPATATDPGGEDCPHPDQPGGYCGADGDTPGTATAALAAGKLALTKDAAQCDDVSAGATIGGLATLTEASFDVSGNFGGGAPRLNVVAADGFHFVSCPAESVRRVNLAAHATCDLSEVSGKAITSINIVYDLSGAVALSNLSFAGEPTPTPTPTPSASASASASPTPTPAVTLAQTGQASYAPLLAVGGFLLVGVGLLTFIARRRVN